MTTIYAVDDTVEPDGIWLSLDGERFLRFSCEPETMEDVDVIRDTFDPREGHIGKDGKEYHVLPMTMAKRALSLLLKLDVSSMRKLEIV